MNATNSDASEDKPWNAEQSTPHRELAENPSGGYWYPRGGDSCSSVDLLNLLREYRVEEKKMRERTRESMRMGETDLVALRFLLRERSAGHTPRQRDLAEALGLTAAATSALVDRLTKDGYIQRIPHPEDRRSVALEVLAETDREVRATLTGMHSRMMAATEDLSEHERVGAAKFLRGLIASVSET